ncbi:PEP-CTERM putative exosortase interaction domain-containing protein [Opitutaceae bacterium TAV1]|nr:PEP-CTERM putative exosortase interaction domain-containing protein [Opitutaceae bacterium TAV1]
MKTPLPANYGGPLRRTLPPALALAAALLLAPADAHAFASRTWIGQDGGSWMEVKNWKDDNQPGTPPTEPPGVTSSPMTTFIDNGTTAVLDHEESIAVGLLGIGTDPAVTSVGRTSGLILNSDLATLGTLVGITSYEGEKVFGLGGGPGYLEVNDGGRLGIGIGIATGVGADGTVALNNGTIQAYQLDLASSNPDDPPYNGMTPGVVVFGNETLRLMKQAGLIPPPKEGPEIPDDILGNSGSSQLWVSGASAIEASSVHFSGNSVTFIGFDPRLQTAGGSATSPVVANTTLTISHTTVYGEESGTVSFYDGAAVIFTEGAKLVLDEGMTLDLSHLSAASATLDEKTGLPATGLTLALLDYAIGSYELIHATDLLFGNGYSTDNLNDLFTILFATSGVETSESGNHWTTWEDLTKTGRLYYRDNALWLEVSAVPEPATYAVLAGLALLAWAALRRRRG